ncbi:MAG: exopolysaccharide biosynthesis protein [Bdellovibrio sp.]
MKSRFIATMDLLQEEALRGDLTLSRVFELLGEEGHAMIILFLCLPFLQPIPIPGLSTPLGVLIVLVAYYLYRDKAPWIPKKYRQIKISSHLLVKVVHVSEKIWGYISHVIKARLVFFHDNWFFKIINLVVFVVNAVLLALPLPIPFSNTVPVIAIVLNAIGHMEKDGALIFISYLWCIAVGIFFSVLAVGAVHLA